MEIPKIVRNFNHRLGSTLGLNPHGEPLYKWVYSEDFFHWMMNVRIEANDVGEVRVSPVLEPVTQPSGLLLMEATYTRRKMCPNMINCWLIAHWNDAGSEAAWRTNYGPKIMWPREGIYTPVNAWTERDKKPTADLTDKVISLVKQIRDEKQLKKLEIAAYETMRSKERQDQRDRTGIIDEAMSGEFGVMPGSHDGSRVIFSEPLTGVTA